jgi:hypothetical protein
MHLQERKSTATARLDELRQSLGANTLDGGGGAVPISDEIAQIERELQAIEAAEGETARRQRAAEAEAEAARLAELKAALAKNEDARLTAYRNAEAAARQLATELKNVLAASRVVRDNILSIGERASIEFVDTPSVLAKLSSRVSTILSTVPGPPPQPRFGRLKLETAIYSAGDDWAKAEKIEGERALQSLQQKETNE